MGSRTVTDLTALSPDTRVAVNAFFGQLYEAGFDMRTIPTLIDLPDRIYDAMRSSNDMAEAELAEELGSVVYMSVASPHGTFGVMMFDGRKLEFGILSTVLDLHGTGIATSDISTDTDDVEADCPGVVNVSEDVIVRLRTLRTMLESRATAG